jgi:hypothetical protein
MFTQKINIQIFVVALFITTKIRKQARGPEPVKRIQRLLCVHIKKYYSAEKEAINVYNRKQIPSAFY